MYVYYYYGSILERSNLSHLLPNVKSTVVNTNIYYFDLPLDNFLFIASSTTNPITASCDQPSPPRVIGGYILTINNASTIEGATVTYVCPENREKTAICTETGQWEPNSTSICIQTTKISGTQTDTYKSVHRIIIT